MAVLRKDLIYRSGQPGTHYLLYQTSFEIRMILLTLSSGARIVRRNHIAQQHLLFKTNIAGFQKSLM